MDLKNSMLLANMMSKKGGGVEFKTYCYALNNATCLIDLGSNNLLAGIYVKGTLTTNYPSTTGWKVMCGGASSSTQYIDSFLSFNNLSTKNTEVKTGNAGGFNTETLIDSSGNIIKTDFESSKKGMNTMTGSKIGIFAQYSNYNNTFMYYVNDFVKIKNIVLYDINDNEIANLVPAIVNGENGMYDTINEQIYGNANSVGSLICE